MIPRARLRQRREKKGGKWRLGNYYAEFEDAHRRPKKKRISLGTKDSATASRRFHDLEKRFDAGTFDPWNDKPPEEGVTFDEAVSRFLSTREDEGLASSSIATYKSVLEALGAFLPPGYPLYGLRLSDLVAFLDDKKRSDATRRSYQQRVRIFGAWCVDESLLKVNPIPAPSTKGKKGREKRLPRFMSDDEVERLVRAVEADAVLKPEIDGGNRWLLDAVHLALGTGLRRGELINLRWGDVDLVHGSVHVRNREGWTTKSGRERVVPLVGDALAIARRLHGERTEEDDEARVLTGVGGDPVNEDYLSKRFAFYRDLARLPKQISFHSLRHTYASRLVQRGASVYKVQALLGHADVKTTQQYAHVTASSLRSDVERAMDPETQGELERLRAEVARLSAENERLASRLAAYEAA